MSTEETNEQEIQRFQEWREGKDFTLRTFNVGDNRCSRCRTEKPHIWALVQEPRLTFAQPVDLSVPMAPPFCENACRDCLTDNEIAILLRPVFYFLVETQIRQSASGDRQGTAILGALATTRAWLSAQDPPKPIKDYREVRLRALEGLKGVPPPDINWDGLLRDLEKALAKDLYIAAHPDDILQSVEGVNAWRERISIFFRVSASVERYALRDAVHQCVELFRRYFYRRVV